MPDKTPAEIVAAAKERCVDTRIAAAWQAAWNRVCDGLAVHYKKQRGLRSFEAHHSTETARLEFLRNAVAGEPLELCERAALEKVGAI